MHVVEYVYLYFNIYHISYCLLVVDRELKVDAVANGDLPNLGLFETLYVAPAEE